MEENKKNIQPQVERVQPDHLAPLYIITMESEQNKVFPKCTKCKVYYADYNHIAHCAHSARFPTCVECKNDAKLYTVVLCSYCAAGIQ